MVRASESNSGVTRFMMLTQMTLEQSLCEYGKVFCREIQDLMTYQPTRCILNMQDFPYLELRFHQIVSTMSGTLSC